MKSTVVAIGSLFLAGALVSVVGAALFDFLLLGQFLLALVGVIGGPVDEPARLARLGVVGEDASG